MAFSGFSDRTLGFLGDLARHNDTEWFHAHRDDYQADLIEPARDFVEAMGPLLVAFAPDVLVEPKIGSSIMRINRDIRFSRDKRPYKDHLDVIFRRGSGKSGAPGYWFRLRPDGLSLGAGTHVFDKPSLERYRQAVDDPATGPALVAAITKLEKTGYDVGGEHYKRVPGGFEANHPRAQLLRYNGLFTAVELGIRPELTTAKLPAFCAAHYRRQTPLLDWLTEAVTSTE
jgi:uncharacterized protein (TIGR02453 family)